MNEAGDEGGEAAPLRLKAFDAEDLAVVSAHLQDAVVRVGDMVHLPKARRFACAAARFDWPLAKLARHQRCVVGLHFDAVLKVSRLGFAQDPDRLLHLRAIVFLPGAPPAGTVLLSFAAGAAIRLDVECLEAALSDIGPRWSVEGMPDLSGA